MDYLGWLLAGLVLGYGIMLTVSRLQRKMYRAVKEPTSVSRLLCSHFHPIAVHEIQAEVEGG